jgi:tripartite-type tricarboxylate transporter receptor subunit TctC
MSHASFVTTRTQQTPPSPLVGEGWGRGLATLLALLSFSALLTTSASAQSWPTRTITLVVPFSAGGALDIPARRLAAELSPKLGQQIVVENRTGANGNIGAATVAKADPDGHTLMFAPPGVLANNRFMFKSMPFDPDRAFAPIILFAKSPVIIASNPKNVPARNLAELIAYAKANPGKLNIGTPGAGSQAHLTMELLQKSTGTQMTYVPYRGGGGSNTDLVGGQIDLSVNFLPAIVSLLKEGSLRGIAVTTLQRSKQIPDVVTVAESGFPGFESVAWYSLVAPAGTPSAIVRTLNTLTNDYLRSELGRQQFDSLDMQPVGGTPEDLTAYIAAEVAKWGPIIKAAGISM